LSLLNFGFVVSDDEGLGISWGAIGGDARFMKGSLHSEIGGPRVPGGLFYSLPNAILFCRLCSGVQVPPDP
jgi:hypothetical protein